METAGSSETSEQYSAWRKNATNQQLRRSKVRTHELKSWRQQQHQQTEGARTHPTCTSIICLVVSFKSRDIVAVLTRPRAERSRVRITSREEMLSFPKCPPLHSLLESSQAGRRSRGTVDHSNSSCAEVKNE